MAQLFQRMQLVDWLDDICVRFIVNLPSEELQSVERIIFQIEEGHWYYEDFIRPLDQTLPSISLKQFCALIFRQCPLLSAFAHYHAGAYAEFSAYKTRVPVRGAIMLNEEMDQAVLVKGWKKGAKWSFPRGKINKDEPDFDCAIREVYEETGYELREAGIATDPVHSKYIDVTLREQQMRLYVFRGVPLDTYFEPRTRKEISKISWYYITDLPGGKSRKQAGEDDTMKSSQFYMVAPFIGPLKQWIKHQKKRDKLNGGLNAPEPVHIDDSGMGTDMEAMAPELADNEAAEARHFRSLLSRLNQPTSTNQESTINDIGGRITTHENELSAQLKALLSVGGSSKPADFFQDPGRMPPPPAPVAGASLMSLLQPSSSVGPPPQTPFDQINSQAHQASTPHYSHAGVPTFDPRIPPPDFPFHPTQNSQHHLPIPYTSLNQPPAPMQYPQSLPLHEPRHQQGNISISGFGSRGSKPSQYVHEAVSEPFGIPARQPQQAQDHTRMNGPPASGPPQPKLTAHSLSLLDAFKSPLSSASHDNTPRQELQPAAQYTPHPQNTTTNDASSLMQAFGLKTPSTVQISPQPTRTELAGNEIPAHQPKLSQANALLDLFRRAPSGNYVSDIGSVDRPAELAPPVAELSAGTPQHPQSFRKAPHTSHPLHVQTAVLSSHARGGQLTSATVSGPLNAPDFDSVVRTRPPVELENNQESSITPVPVHSVSPGMPLEAPRALHHPSILDRQTTPANMALISPPSIAPQPAVPASSDNRSTMPADHKSTLMSLFGKATMPSLRTGPSRCPPSHPSGGLALANQRPPSQASPVSPLPERRMPVKSHYINQQYTPQQIHSMAKSSRVSSFAEDTLPSSSGLKSPATPVEKKDFLYQYLADVVNKEGRK